MEEMTKAISLAKQSPEPAYIISEKNIPETTINKMNYAALIYLLTYLLEEQIPLVSTGGNEVITIRCGCFMVYQQMTRQMASQALKAEYTIAAGLLHKLQKNHPHTVFNIYYDDKLRPPPYLGA